MPSSLPTGKPFLRTLQVLLLCALVHVGRAIPGAAAAPGSVQVSGDATIVEDAAGKVSLRLGAPDGRATLVFNYPASRLDLSAHRDLTLRLQNASSSELDLLLTGISDLAVQWRGNVQGRFLVRPSEDAELHVLLIRSPLPADHPFVKRLGNLYGFPFGHHRHWVNLEPDAIQRVTARLTWRQARAGEKVTLSHPFGSGFYSTDPALLDTLEMPLLDAFGQLRMGEWPGKLTDEAELAADAARDREFAARPATLLSGWNQYGGWAAGPQLEATGFFRVQRHEGKWWFVDPEGRLFWSVGANGTGSFPETRVTGREELFPEQDRASQSIRHLQRNIGRKFGADTWLQTHLDLTVARMHDWGLNTLGGWSYADMARTRRVPFTLVVHSDLQSVGNAKKMVDPWSDAFKNSLHKRLGAAAQEHAGNPWLIGVFIDNELEWRGDIGMGEETLRVTTSTPARLALHAFLKERHGDIAGLNKAWDTGYASFEDLRPKPGPNGQEAYQQDIRAFSVHFTETYFQVCREMMTRYFPGHLYLGCRFHTFPPIITEVASRFCDVISVNIYRNTVEDFALPGTTDRPWIISEFHFGIKDFGTWGNGLIAAADARNQADLYRAYLSDALRHPNFVGAHWFQWASQTVTGRFDGENFGVGLVSVADRPITSLTDSVRHVSNALYGFRLNPTAHRIPAPTP